MTQGAFTADDLLPEGLADRLPQEAAAMTRVMRAVLDAMDAHGYDRVRPPLVEFEHSLASRMDGVSAAPACSASPIRPACGRWRCAAT